MFFVFHLEQLPQNDPELDVNRRQSYILGSKKCDVSPSRSGRRVIPDEREECHKARESIGLITRFGAASGVNPGSKNCDVRCDVF